MLLFSLLIATTAAPEGILAQPPLTASQRGAGTVSIHRHNSDLLPPDLTIAGVPLGTWGLCDLQLEQIETGSPTQVVVVGADGATRPMDVAVQMYRGHVLQDPGSHLFLGIGSDITTGWITHSDGSRIDLGSWTDRPPSPARSPNVPLCGVDGEHDGDLTEMGDDKDLPDSPDNALLIELAIETDWEYRQLFDSTEAAAEYAMFVYTAVSEIYRRDTNSAFHVSFLRIWETEDDLFNEENPITELREYWNENMTEVDRDLVQFFSGRRDFPYGGVAYLRAICSDYHYGIVGYALGESGDVTAPGVMNYDVHVTAHELGHNCGSSHTHSYGIDNCFDLDNTPVRGGIMSYCSQTVSGGNAVTDLRFHTICQSAINYHYTDAESCLERDCNGNLLPDAQDIIDGISMDTNVNGVPDECEDCNANGILDPEEIAGDTTLDADGNGVPDECQPDCNGNGIPDVLDIATGVAEDVWGNGIPDACEADCDSNGLHDYNELQSNMALDLDRDLVLDHCADCDGDGIRDLDELDGAWGGWIGAGDTATAAGVHPLVGTVLARGGDTTMGPTWDLVITEDERIILSVPTSDALLVLDRTGSHVATWTDDGMTEPTGLLVRGDDLLVSSSGTGEVLRLDLATGAVEGTLVAAGSGSLVRPLGLESRSDGAIVVADDTNAIRLFDGASGEALGDLVSVKENQGLLSPRSMEIISDDRLLVASMDTDQVLAFDQWTGAPLGQFNDGGTKEALTMDKPWGVRKGPTGGVYVTRSGGEDDGHGGGGGHGLDELHINATRVYLFQEERGIFIRSYVTGNDTELHQPRAIDFMPGDDSDCNRNHVADDCDIASGASADINNDGTPDECQCLSDIDGSGSVGVGDVLLILDQWGCSGTCSGDIDGSGVVDVTDLLILLGAWGDC